MHIENVHLHFGGAAPLLASALLAAAFTAPEAAAPTASQAPAVAKTPPNIGEYWAGQGGIYVGIARGFGDQRDAHLVLAIDPRSKFEERQLGTYGVDVKGATSDHDGRANTIALAEAGSDLCKEILALEIDGHKDFALMSRREAALCWANVPEQFEKEWHLTSTQYSADYAWSQSFYDGYQTTSRKLFEARARLFRRLFL